MASPGLVDVYDECSKTYATLLDELKFSMTMSAHRLRRLRVKRGALQTPYCHSFPARREMGRIQAKSWMERPQNRGVPCGHPLGPSPGRGCRALRAFEGFPGARTVPPEGALRTPPRTAHHRDPERTQRIPSFLGTQPSLG